MSLWLCSHVHANEPVLVIGVGSNFTEARHDAFRQAIEYKVKTLVLSQRHHKNNQTILDEIIVHSSGYVDNYKIRHNRRFSNRVELEVEVLVSDSKIANRLKSPSNNTLIIDGERHAAQRDTFLEQRKTGDKVLRGVLSDFPVNAFHLNTQRPVFSLDQYGNSMITIGYQMVWKYNFLRALHEVIDLLNDGPKGYTPYLSNGAKTEIQLNGHVFGNVFSKQQYYTFTNSQRVDILKEVLSDNSPYLRLVFLDENSNMLSDKCYTIDKTYGRSFYDFNRHTKVSINGNYQLFSSLTVYLDFPVELLHKYELSIIPAAFCQRR